MSEVKVDKISPRAGTDVTLGDSGDTFTVPSGATLAVASGATVTNSGTANGFGGGKVVQLVRMTNATQETTTSLTYVSTAYTLTITPASSSNIIFVIVDFNARCHHASVAELGAVYKLTNTTDTYDLAERRMYVGGPSASWDHQMDTTLMGYDTGRSVATTYLLQQKVLISGDTAMVDSGNFRGSMVIMEIEA